MLVLTRKLGESIAIDDNIKITVVQIKGKQVRLGIQAPKDTKIHREEVYMAIQDQNHQSVQVSSDKIKNIGNASSKYFFLLVLRLIMVSIVSDLISPLTISCQCFIIHKMLIYR